MVGPRPDLLGALADYGDSVTVLHEPRHANMVGDLAHLIDRAVALPSYDNIDAILGATYLDTFDAIVTVWELSVIPVALVAQHRHIPWVPVESALRCRDKALQKQAWRAAGIPISNFSLSFDHLTTPAPRVASSLESAYSFPLIVKPPALGGSSDVHLVHDATAATRLLTSKSSLSTALIEEYQPSPEWHIDGVMQAGGLTHLMVSRYVHPVLATKSGTPVQSLTYPRRRHPELYEELLDLTSRSLRALGSPTCAFHFEVFGAPGEWIAGELACRPGGALISDVAERYLGVNLWRASALLQTQRGSDIPAPKPSPDEYLGYVHLPAQAGKLSTVTEESIRNLQGVYYARLTVQAGQPMPDMTVTSAKGIGFAAVEGLTEQACLTNMQNVIDATWAMLRQGGSAE